MIHLKSLSFIYLLILSFSLLASDLSVTTIRPNNVGKFKHGIGSEVEIKSEDTKISGEAIFLGDIQKPNGEAHYQMYLIKKSKKVFFIESEFFTRKNSKLQKVVDPFEQVGETCTGYALNSFIHQTHLSGFIGTGILAKELSTEEGRTQLLAHAINEYYLTPRHRYSIPRILNGYGKKYGFSCKMLQTDSYNQVKDHLLEKLKSGLPVVVSYNIGPEMVQSPFKLSMYGSGNIQLDQRLWIPRKRGERNSGGHTIIVAGVFEFNDRKYLVTLDSDWTEPRVWDMDLFLNHEKTALKEIEFISCD